MFARQAASCIASSSRPVRTPVISSHVFAIPRSPSLAFLPRFAHKKTQTKPPVDKMAMRDENIKKFLKEGNQNIRVVSQGSLGDWTPLEDVLASIDRQTQFLQLVSKNPVIVKIRTFEEDQQAIRDALRARREERKLHRGEGKKAEKEFQLTWSVETGDLHHKMDRVRDTLLDGRRAAVVITSKPGTAPPSDVRRAQIQKSVYDAVEGVGLEARQPELTRRAALLFFKPLPAKEEPKEESPKEES